MLKCKRRTTGSDVMVETKLHREEVKNGVDFLCELLEDKGRLHDWTKIIYKNLYLESLDDADGGEWFKVHVITERHHPNSFCHNDINLLDIIEMVVDCVMTGLSRDGEVCFDFLNIDPTILQKAVYNTATLLIDEVEFI